MDALTPRPARGVHHRQACLLAGLLLALGPLARPAAGQVQLDKMIVVRSGGARIHADASSTSPILSELPAGSSVSLDGQCTPGQWCNVFVPGQVHGAWIAPAELYWSKAVANFKDDDYAGALSILAGEIRAATDPVVASWLRFWVGHAEWGLKRPDRAASIYRDLGGPATFAPFRPLAYVLAARVEENEQDYPAEVLAYRALLAAFPGFTLDADGCRESAVIPDRELCAGAESIAARITAIETFLTRRRDPDRMIADASASPEQKAGAWYALGQLLEAKSGVDPGPHFETGIPDRDEASAAYQHAVDIAPGSTPAGDAAWRLIDFSAPYEWEGFIGEEADWTVGWYTPFLKTYPHHPHAGDAMYRLGLASWARAGYPEAFGYYDDRSDARRQYLNRWFDTERMGGPIRDTPHPQRARVARQILQGVAAKYPHAASAPMAQYYAAVISDFCLHERQTALAEYTAFLTRFRGDPAFVARAKKRIAELRKPAS